jgi:nucleoside-diphosphate-sugar epimerase
MDRLAGKRITVTGGAGFLGSYVVQKLRDLGVQASSSQKPGLQSGG